jgi:hypothetical protein
MIYQAFQLPQQGAAALLGPLMPISALVTQHYCAFTQQIP